MNIAFVNSTRKWGGVKTWCLDMATNLRQQGQSTFIVGRAGPFTEKCRAAGIPTETHEFGFDLNPASIVYFLNYFCRNAIDVLVANVSKDLRTAGIAARMLGIPIVQHIGAPRDVVDSAKTRLTQRLLKPSIVTCSQHVTDRLRSLVPIFEQYEVQAIHPGTRPADSPPGSCRVPRTIIATSQLNGDKGHRDLLGALHLLKEKGIDFRCIIVGTGNYADKLHTMSEEYGLADLVEFTGFVTNVQAQLARADIFVLPTFAEPLGIALEEAMAHGLVPVARDAGGPPEIWPPDMRELLMSPEDGAAGFAQRLESLLHLSDESLLDMKHRVYNHAVDTFELNKQARIFLQWMQGLVPGAE